MLHVERYRPRPAGPDPAGAHPGPAGAEHPAAGDPVPADPVVLLHGFTQSGGAWAPVTWALVAGGHEVVTVDAPGHGRSGDVAADLWESARMIVEAAGAGSYVGYSMGARMALHVALAHPEALRRLVLVSGTAGIEGEDERAARRASDEEVARRVEREGVDAFVEWWLQRPLFATLSREAAALDSRLGASPAGLAASLRLAGTGTQEPLWDRLGAIAVPTLVVVGELDERYRGLGERLVAGIGPNATLEVVAGAGHAVPLERPDPFAELLRRFLAAPGPS